MTSALDRPMGPVVEYTSLRLTAGGPATGSDREAHLDWERPTGGNGAIVEEGDESMPTSRSIVALFVLAAGASGCLEKTTQTPDERACTAQFVYGLAVTVQDVASGQRICDADVVAIDGSYRETLRSFGPSESCTYSGAGERPGVYELHASKTGFDPASVAGVRVASDPCHVVPVPVTMALAR